MNSFLSLRERIAGTIQDVAAGITIIVFLTVGMAYLEVVI